MFGKNQNGDTMVDSIDPENLGELLLKNAALTVSSKSISQDLKEVIQMKVDFVNGIYDKTIKLTDTFLSSPNKKLVDDVSSNNGALTQTLNHILSEIFVTNMAINNLLVSIVLDEKNIREEQKRIIESDIGTMIDREMKKRK